jgi:nicotinamide-nucleotide amidase
VRIETICTGDELLTGLTVDTNSQFFQTRLLEVCGATVRRSTTVGDRREDIIEALVEAAARCDAVLVSGGLGPTADDLTAECAAVAAGVALVEHPAVLAHLRERFARRGVTLAENSRRQALVPAGAEVELNLEGSAPLIIQPQGRCTFFFVPGVPREYRHLVERHVVPRLATLLGHSTVRVLRVLKTTGTSESQLDALLAPLSSAHPRLTFGYRTHPPKNHLKLLAEGETREAALAALALAEQAVRQVVGQAIFGADDDTLASVTLQALRARRQRLALAESCTGGLIAAQLTEVAGASDVLWGGAVTYVEAAKTKWAQVPTALLSAFGAVSRACAEAMATGIRAEAGVDWGLSVTGFAGPTGGTAADPVGTVYLGVAGPGGTQVERLHLHGDRERVRRFAAHAALDLLRRTVEGAAP